MGRDVTNSQWYERDESKRPRVKPTAPVITHRNEFHIHAKRQQNVGYRAAEDKEAFYKK
jgi:hypothetical protein